MSRRWWVLAAVVVVALAAGYGWGSLASSTSSLLLPHRAGLCGGPIPDYLAVERVGGLYTSNGVIEPANLPQHVVLTDNPRIVWLRNAIGAAPAPKLTDGVHCPDAYPLVYDMTFASDAGTSLLAVAEFSPTGCDGLSGLGLTSRSPNMKFEEALLAAMGQPPASFNRGVHFWQCDDPLPLGGPATAPGRGKGSFYAPVRRRPAAPDRATRS